MIHIESFTLKRSSKLQTIEWNRFGIKLHVPPDAFSESNYNNITVGVSLSGNFKFPTNTSLVSAVYYIESSSKLYQPITVEVEHCWISSDKNYSKQLSFLAAEMHPTYLLPHTFQTVPGGIFSSTSQWGSIQVSSFSSWLYAIMSLVSGDYNINYSAQIYWKKTSKALFYVRLVVTRHLSSCKEVSSFNKSCMCRG